MRPTGWKTRTQRDSKDSRDNKDQDNSLEALVVPAVLRVLAVPAPACLSRRPLGSLKTETSTSRRGLGLPQAGAILNPAPRLRGRRGARPLYWRGEGDPDLQRTA